jgi:hypothetical protein
MRDPSYGARRVSVDGPAPPPSALGVTPWSPLKIGDLSGKYTVARVALAWVQARPAVTSTIIGARTPAHLDGRPSQLLPFGVTKKGDHY